MNDEKAKRFVSVLKMFSGLVKFELTDDIVIFYLESLKGFDLKAATDAIIKLARSAKVGRGLPSVHEILEIISPAEVAELDAGDEAAVVAGRIEQALVRYGSRTVEGKFKEQEEFIGPLGWSVVGKKWSHMCETTQNRDLPTLKAQWRMEIKGVYNRVKAGLPEAPALPGGDVHPKVLNFINQIGQETKPKPTEPPPW